MKSHLPNTPLDIIGDIHGEIGALQNLMKNLGYDDEGRHLDGRSLVFVGDLVDRGPDSLGVVRIVKGLIESGHGFAILGNHELNLLRGKHKEGNDWFWEASEADQENLLAFFASLPLTLSRLDLRIAHAAWDQPSVERMANLEKSGSTRELFDKLEKEINATLDAEGWLEGEKIEKAQWEAKIKERQADLPVLPNISHCEEARQNLNPLKVLTSGPEGKAVKTFWTSGKHRFLKRLKWWDEYRDETPVVVGHYWRQYVPFDRKWVEKDDPNLFEGIAPIAWVGKRSNVFCVDYSVGARSQERLHGKAGERTKLGALRWPERVLFLDTGETVATLGFERS